MDHRVLVTVKEAEDATRLSQVFEISGPSQAHKGKPDSFNSDPWTLDQVSKWLIAEWAGVGRRGGHGLASRCGS